MRIISSLVGAWLEIGWRFVYMAGLVLLLVVVGAAIYAQWIRPEADVNDVVNTQVLGRVPGWLWYAIKAAGLPMLILMTLGALSTAWIMLPLVGVVELMRWLHRQLMDRSGRAT